jgi:hypothetical protein
VRNHHTMKTYQEVEVKRHTFLLSSLDSVGFTSCSDLFTFREKLPVSTRQENVRALGSIWTWQ